MIPPADTLAPASRPEDPAEDPDTEDPAFDRPSGFGYPSGGLCTGEIFWCVR